MEKIIGIKSVDFKITARGHGVINWNGPTNLMGEDGKTVDNHTLPKLRGYSNLSGEVNEKGYKYRKKPQDINFKENPLYISQNCIRHHLFREQAFDLQVANKQKIKDFEQKILISETGLLRGYVIPKKTLKRTSPLLLEDFVDQLGNGNFEQMGRSGSKEKEINKKGEEKNDTFFSKTTFGDTYYISYGSLSIEQLQFISLDHNFDRCAMSIKDGQGDEIAFEITKYLESLNDNYQPKAVFHPNYVRKGTIFNEGEAGILLNDDAIKILVEHTINKIKNLVIRQAKGYMYVDEVITDFNESHKMMRIKSDLTSINEKMTSNFAVYFFSN